MTDSNTQEIVRAINRNTDELRRITAELKRQNKPVKIKVGPEVQNVTQRLQEPLKDHPATFGPDEFEAKWGERPAGFEREDG